MIGVGLQYVFGDERATYQLGEGISGTGKLTPSHAPAHTLILSSPPSLYRAASSAIS